MENARPVVIDGRLRQGTTDVKCDGHIQCRVKLDVDSLVGARRLDVRYGPCRIGASIENRRGAVVGQNGSGRRSTDDHPASIDTGDTPVVDTPQNRQNYIDVRVGPVADIDSWKVKVLIMIACGYVNSMLNSGEW